MGATWPLNLNGLNLIDLATKFPKFEKGVQGERNRFTSATGLQLETLDNKRAPLQVICTFVESCLATLREERVTDTCCHQTSCSPTEEKGGKPPDDIRCSCWMLNNTFTHLQSSMKLKWISIQSNWPRHVINLQMQMSSGFCGNHLHISSFGAPIE